MEQFGLFKMNMLLAKEKSETMSYIDNGNVIYDFLLKNNLLEFTPKLVKSATKYAHNIIKVQHIKKTGRGFGVKKPNILEISTPANVKTLQRRYAVNKWLRSIKDKELIDLILTFKPQANKV
jgi:hypothetical protein